MGEESEIVKQILQAGYGPESMRQDAAAGQVKDPSGPVTPHEKAIAEYAKKQQPAADGTTTEVPAYEPGKFLKEYLKANEGFKPLTAEQQAAEKKRQERNMLLGSIGDALSAFHTAYAKSRGMQPMVNPGESLTGKMRERYERLNKEYEANVKEYNARLMAAKQMDAQAAKDERNWRAQMERYRIQDERIKAQEAKEDAKEKQANERRDALAKYEIYKGQGDNQQAAYFKALANGFTPQQAAEIAANTPKAKPAKKRGKGYASTKTEGNTTIYYDNKGNVVRRVVRTPGANAPDSQVDNSILGSFDMNNVL